MPRLCAFALATALLAVSGCGGSGSGVGEVSAEAHCGKDGTSTGCRCNQYCQNTNCGLCRAATAGLVAEPPAAGASSCVAGFAAGYPCHNVDLLAFLPLSALGGGSGNDVWGWTDSLTGKEYAILGRSTGASFVDISDPENPVYLGSLPTHTISSLWRNIKVYADHAFIGSEASNHGLQVFDLRQLRNVANPPVTFSETTHYAGFGNSHTLAIDESSGFLFAVGSNTCSGGPHIVDVHDPEHPVFAGCVSSDGYTHETQCVVYAGPDSEHVGQEICFSSNEDTITIVDVSTKNATLQLSRNGYPGAGYTHQGWLTEDHRYFLLDDELDEVNFGHRTHTYVWDMADLEAPVLLGHYTSSQTAIDHNLYIAGNHAFQSNYRAGLRVLRLDDLAQAQLTEIGFFDIYPPDDDSSFNGTWSNYPFFASGVVAVSGIEQGLYLVRPNLTGEAFTPTPQTPSATPTITRTRTPTRTRTETRTRTVTRTKTPTRTATSTREPSATKTPSSTRTRSSTRTPTATRTRPPAPSPSRTPDPAWTSTPTRRVTPSRTPTTTRTPTNTRFPTRTRTPTKTRTGTRTRTPTRTPV